ncbi:MAG: phosphate acyltransferase PlsX [Chloroflexota bacterium]|nr:phosphate acyltransferase PlsX [Chloroflexota bacterium]
MSEKVRVALDVMGGDYAPEAPIEGAVMASKAYPDIQVIVVGPEEIIHRELSKHPNAPDLEIVPASEVIEMDEKPAQAVKAKKDSSMVVGMRLVKNKEVDAFFSTGNTGGMLAAGILHLGRIRGITRPALSGLTPTMKQPTFLLDLGANADVKPAYLQQFALMGSIYVERVLRRPSPRVGLLSTGEEEGKGSMLVQEAYELIEQLPINFTGNAEGNDIWNGSFDVIVTDGFTGNVVLKSAEGMARMIKALLKDTFKGDPLSMLSGLLFAPLGAKRLQKVMDAANEIGGAPLLGLNGVAMVGHGSANAYAIHNGIRTTGEVARSQLIEAIAEGIAQVQEKSHSSVVME